VQDERAVCVDKSQYNASTWRFKGYSKVQYIENITTYLPSNGQVQQKLNLD